MPSVSTVCHPSCSWLDQQGSAENHRLSPPGDPRVPETSQRCHRGRFTDEQRRRLAAKAKGLRRNTLEQFAEIVTPDTLLELLQEPRRQEIRRICQARSRTPQDARQHLRYHGPYGKREPILMIHSNQGCPAESRDHREPKHGETYSHRSWYRTGTRTKSPHSVDDLL